MHCAQDVAEAVAKCRSASVQVAMVTGDHSSTAIAIARQVNALLSSFGLLGPFPLLSSVLRGLQC